MVSAVNKTYPAPIVMMPQSKEGNPHIIRTTIWSGRIWNEWSLGGCGGTRGGVRPSLKRVPEGDDL